MVKMDGEFKACPFLVDPEKETLRIMFPEEMAGDMNLKIDYVGQINDRMAGFYRSRYQTEGEERFIAVTQFEESDARRAFPCFDHPVKKATFDVEMVIDKDLVAISNGALIEETSFGQKKRLVKFERTPKMSTYLLFFGVGPFEFIEDQGEVLFRLAAMPGMTRYGGFGLDFGRKSLEFSEEYYGIKYPMPKLDLIAIADFAAGAMENWGAITFRENLLLHHPGITSKAGEERICEVIAHEMAHQWFGNLVSPSDWKYLWLNESFATYFGFGIVAHYYPEWEIWDQFLSGTTDVALIRDSLHETFSIEIPGGEHVVINASTAPIIYSKGGSILRQVEGYIGHEGFKAGLRHYLKQHEYGCASSHHLWEALEEASSQPVTRLMKSWVEQPGHPVVEVKREGGRLHFTQKRFTFLPNTFEQQWLIPINIELFYENGKRDQVSILMEERDSHLEIGEDVVAYKVNLEQTGFYRVCYQDSENLDALGSKVSEKVLSPEDRWGLQNDLYAMVRAGKAGLSGYLDFLSHYAHEDVYLPMTSITGNLYHAYLIMEGGDRERIATLGRSLIEGLLEKIGYEPTEDEKHTVSILRDQILWHAAVYGSDRALAFASDKFQALCHGEEAVHADIMKSVMRIGALTGGSEAHRWFQERFQSTESEHDRMNILMAMGSFKERALIEKVQQYILDTVPARNQFIPVGVLSSNPYACEHMWEWYTGHLEKIEQFHPMHYERVIASIVPMGGLGREREVKTFFEDYISKKDKARDVIKLSLEKLEANSRMRRSG
jgi:tricorn protease interacting factor F2/3